MARAPRAPKPRPQAPKVPRLTGRALRGMKGRQGPGIGPAGGIKLVGGPAALKRGSFKSAPRMFRAEMGKFAATWRAALTDLVRRVHATREIAIEAFKAAAVQIVADIAEATPVDTGHARRAWRGPEFTETPGKVKALIYNATDYIVFLEYGWSRQAPQGMVRVTLERHRRSLRDNLGRIA